jgi:hypothetical protein
MAGSTVPIFFKNAMHSFRLGVGREEKYLRKGVEAKIWPSGLKTKEFRFGWK